MKRLAPLAATVVLAGFGLTGCDLASASDDATTIVVGYQSKTINTVTAGTLLKAQGYFEDRLAELGKGTGETYKVEWQDYDTGAPITAQMLAGKIDIGSMGDYPLLINGATAGKSEKTTTELVSVTGYNLSGALNGVVVREGSEIKKLTDLEGKKVSASVGSAGHGTLLRALTNAGIDPVKDVQVENQTPAIGAGALQTGSVDALSQFVAWPGYLVYRDHDQLIYDGGALDLPTFHGVVVRKAFAEASRGVLDAFLQAQVDATDFLHENPVEAAKIVAETAGLPSEVVYLYNGRGGVATFDPTVKPQLVDALEQDVPFLESIGVLADKLDLESFVNDEYLSALLGTSYADSIASTANPAAITGADEVCNKPVKNAAVAGEVWVEGEADTRPVADAVCLLRNIKAIQDEGQTLRAAYIPDALTGTRWFADQSVWVKKGKQLLPFATVDNANTWIAGHGGSVITYEAALKAA